MKRRRKTTMSNKRQTINDEDRRQWVENDEGLYRWYKSSHLPIREFIRRNRSEIDLVIENVRDGRKQAHYLAYGG
jgi:hypothetical protein